MAATDSAEGVRVRWLVAGAFGPSPTGERFGVSPASFPAVLQARGLHAEVEIDDRLGAGPRRTFALSFPTLKSFHTAEVIAVDPLLRDLLALGASLGQGDATKRPEAAAAVERVVALVGEGRLSAALRAKLSVAAPATPAGAPPAAPGAPAAAGGGASLLGDLLDQPIVPAAPAPAPTPAVAVSSFIKAMRPAGPAAVAPGLGRAGRDLLEAEVYATAADILRSPGVAALEGAWRSLKLLVDACPDAAGMHLEVIDVAPDKAEAALREALPTVPEEEGPDALFVLDPVEGQEALLAFANLGADADAPVVVSVTESLFGQSDVHAVSAKIEAEDGSMPAWWPELRADESTRWLSVAFNRPVVRVEGNGAARRVVFGSAAAAVGAMLAESYHRTGAFARILGATGALKGAGSYELPSGRDQGMLVPTEAFLSIRAQSRLHELGVVGLGSARNSDSIVLSAAGTVRGGTDVVPLAAQVLTGRIVRFARWVLAQLPPGSNESEVKLLFEQASEVFLFPTARESARLEAQVVAAEGGARQVVLQASARADLAGIPFHLAFALPLRG